jgi:hypothetical protein
MSSVLEAEVIGDTATPHRRHHFRDVGERSHRRDIIEINGHMTRQSAAMAVGRLQEGALYRALDELKYELPACALDPLLRHADVEQRGNGA